MNPKQERFCEEYLIDLNATQAAIRSGYSVRTASSQGERLLRNVDIAQRIGELQRQRGERVGIDADGVLERLKKIADADIRKVFAADGSLLPPQSIDADTTYAIASLDVSEKSHRIRLLDRLRALELIGRHLGMFVDRTQLESQQAGQVHIYIPDNGRDATGNEHRPTAHPANN